MDTVDILNEFKCLNKMAKKINTIQKIDLNCLHVDYEIFKNSKKDMQSLPFTKSSEIDFSINISQNSQSNFHSLTSSNIFHNTNFLSSHIQNKKELKNHKLSYIYDLISVDPISINELCKKTAKPISQISNDLLLLELEGYVQKVAGGYICILSK